MSKFVKEMVMQDIESRLDGTRDVLVVDSSRMDAISDNGFRQAMQEKNVHLLTVKNSLARKVLGEAGAALGEVLKGPSTLVWGGEDIVALSKEVTKWAKKIEPLQVKGASVEGQPLDTKGVEKLSKSPGRAELISQIAGLILSPGGQLAGALLGPGGKLAGCVKAVEEKAEA
ncbi:50S ribosomal protein L10 [Rubinisphaera italica]|uniref:Large ribosomal subunit protein uL10 n=1 Tax=Rubinisphaera italica TaxID=2527969 RepID=A0A5C5XAT8_9PLAN|nr:50S ribosomal protein L10 [Rubinisphaera italica]TWT59403.1 50S ribosomal protein L10 [Rubinisphaera italica]